MGFHYFKKFVIKRSMAESVMLFGKVPRYECANVLHDSHKHMTERTYSKTKKE